MLASAPKQTASGDRHGTAWQQHDDPKTDRKPLTVAVSYNGAMHGTSDTVLGSFLAESSAPPPHPCTTTHSQLVQFIYSAFHALSASSTLPTYQLVQARPPCEGGGQGAIPLQHDAYGLWPGRAPFRQAVCYVLSAVCCMLCAVCCMLGGSWHLFRGLACGASTTHVRNVSTDQQQQHIHIIIINSTTHTIPLHIGNASCIANIIRGAGGSGGAKQPQLPPAAQPKRAQAGKQAGSLLSDAPCHATPRASAMRPWPHPIVQHLCYSTATHMTVLNLGNQDTQTAARRPILAINNKHQEQGLGTERARKDV